MISGRREDGKRQLREQKSSSVNRSGSRSGRTQEGRREKSRRLQADLDLRSETRLLTDEAGDLYYFEGELNGYLVV